MKVLVIAAHPDDEVYGMGGTIAKLSEQGHQVYVLIITDGCTSQYRNSENINDIIYKKQRETRIANEILGVKEVFFCDLPDMHLNEVPHVTVNEKIEAIIKSIKPEEVYTHFYGDVNLDHQIVYKSTLVATRPIPNQSVKRLYAYSVPSSTEWTPHSPGTSFLPNVFSDIKNYINIKEMAIKAYETEVRNYPHPRSCESVKALDLAVGLQCGLESCESFVLLRSLV